MTYINGFFFLYAVALISTGEGTGITWLMAIMNGIALVLAVGNAENTDGN